MVDEEAILAYNKQMRSFLYQHHSNEFKMKFIPSSNGFGSILCGTCLGHPPIDLSFNWKEKDGGRGVGCGTILPFETHCNTELHINSLAAYERAHKSSSMTSKVEEEEEGDELYLHEDGKWKRTPLTSGHLPPPNYNASGSGSRYKLKDIKPKIQETILILDSDEEDDDDALLFEDDVDGTGGNSYDDIIFIESSDEDTKPFLQKTPNREKKPRSIGNEDLVMVLSDGDDLPDLSYTSRTGTSSHVKKEFNVKKELGSQLSSVAKGKRRQKDDDSDSDIEIMPLVSSSKFTTTMTTTSPFKKYRTHSPHPSSSATTSKGKGKEMIRSQNDNDIIILDKSQPKPRFYGGGGSGDVLSAASARFIRKTKNAENRNRVGGNAGEGEIKIRKVTPIIELDDQEEEELAERKIVFNNHHVMKAAPLIPEVEAAAKRLGMATSTSLLKGMRIPLLPFQVIGVDWMNTRELSQFPGGINADDMGLGKTVQTLAIMCHRKSTDPIIKTNLIIVPLSCVSQWENEIRTKCKGLSTHIYHLGMNKGKATSVASIMSYDVVITTHGTVSGEFKDKEKSGILFDCLFYRVVVDEAQIIRTRTTRISKACSQLDAVYRWLLTGTPVINTLADIYPLLRFLRVKPYNHNWKLYNQKVVRKEKKDPVGAGRAAQEILQPYIIRRRKDDLLAGKPLIELKPKKVELVKLFFSEKEREIYDLAEREAQDQLARLFRKGTVIKNWSHIFVMILRLRQLTIHPLLLTEEGTGGIDLLAERARAIQLMTSPVVARLVAARIKNKMMSDRSSHVKLDMMNCCSCHEPVEGNNGYMTACTHIICDDCWRNVPNDENVAKKACPSCHQLLPPQSVFNLDAFEPTDDELAKATDNAEAFDSGSSAEEDEFRAGKDVKPKLLFLQDKKPKLPQASTSTKMIIVHDSDSEDDDLPPLSTFFAKIEAKVTSEAKRTVKSEDIKPKFEDRKPDRKPDIKPRFQKSDRVEPSTKMIHLVKQLKAFELEDPLIKTVVICSFVGALDLVDNILTAEGIAFVRFQGSSTPDERATTLRDFAKVGDDECRVMLLSLKAGGVGLNLTSACRVISLDLAWSPMIENQAIDRVHRLGQTREVGVERLTCDDTIEERIAVLQSRKQLYFDFSLKEGQGHPEFKGKLTLTDILGLFKLDKNGQRLNNKAATAEASVKAGLGPRGGGLAGGRGGGRGGRGGGRNGWGGGGFAFHGDRHSP